MTEFDATGAGASPDPPDSPPEPTTPIHADVIFEDSTTIPPLLTANETLTANEITAASLPTFTQETASSKAQELTKLYPTLIPAAKPPTETNTNTAVRVDDQKTGWFAEISVDDDHHHQWLTDQIEAYLAAKT